MRSHALFLRCRLARERKVFGEEVHKVPHEEQVLSLFILLPLFLVSEETLIVFDRARNRRRSPRGLSSSDAIR